MTRPVHTQENFPWTGSFSLSCELPCTTNGFKTKEIFLSEENFPECKRVLTHPLRMIYTIRHTVCDSYSGVSTCNSVNACQEVTVQLSPATHDQEYRGIISRLHTPE